MLEFEQEQQVEVKEEKVSFIDDLLSFVDEAEAVELDIQGEGFSIQSMDQANYFARKLRELREERAEAEAAAKKQLDAYKERVDQWLTGVSNPLVNQETRLLNLLETFASEKLNGTKKKSLKLIEGTLQFRSQGDKFEYDDKALLAYAEDNLKDFVKRAPSVDKAGLKQEVKVKGGRAFYKDVEIAGITVMPQPDKFDVK